MKLAFLALLSVIALTAQGAVTWYDPVRNNTCTGSDEGAISCEPGHIGEAEEYIVPPEHQVSPNRGRSDNGLEKRVTCNLDAKLGLTCFAHCFAMNYCNAWCDSENTCHCKCWDNWYGWPLPCVSVDCSRRI